MHWLKLLCVAPLLLACSVSGAGADFDAEVRRDSEALQRVLPVCEQLMNAGDFAGANARLLAVFPAGTRTPAQSFLLGNLLFELDRKQSYALHEAAAKAEPANAAVVWEWGLEQHRAGRYAGALESYRTFSKSSPRSAVSYALQADCLLRLDRVDEAVDAWMKSEKAPDGTNETMEALVCAVHREPAPHERRAALLAKATKDRDPGAAADLIALDCDFPRDWWNAGPHEGYLAHDAPAVTAALKLPADDPRARAIACAVECATAEGGDAVAKALTKHRLLLDADHTVPVHGGLLSAILARAVEEKAVDEASLRRQIGPKVLELARKGRDVKLWNAAVFAGPVDLDELLKLEREAWKATADLKFSGGALLVRSQRGQIRGDDAELAAALKQFPENGVVQRVAYEVAVRERKLTRDRLAAAARAEFTHFSSFVAPATVVNRPRSNYLRQYFKEMARLPAATKPATRPGGSPRP